MHISKYDCVSDETVLLNKIYHTNKTIHYNTGKKISYFVILSHLLLLIQNTLFIWLKKSGPEDTAIIINKDAGDNDTTDNVNKGMVAKISTDKNN